MFKLFKLRIDEIKDCWDLGKTYEDDNDLIFSNANIGHNKKHIYL